MKKFFVLFFLLSVGLVVNSCTKTESDDRMVTYTVGKDFTTRGDEGAEQRDAFCLEIDDAIVRVGSTSYGDRLKMIGELDDIVKKYDHKGIKGQLTLYGKMDTNADRKVFRAWILTYGE